MSEPIEWTDADLLEVAKRVISDEWECGLSWNGISAGDFLMATDDDGDAALALSMVVASEHEYLADMGIRLRKLMTEYGPQWLLDKRRDELCELADEIDRDKKIEAAEDQYERRRDKDLR